MIERAKTGVYGLDDFIEGGVPKGCVMIVAGAAGTGKTLFASQFAYYGAVKYDEPTLLITLDERYNSITKGLSRFGFDIDNVPTDKLYLLDASKVRRSISADEEKSVFNVQMMMELIDETLQTFHPKRIVLDSLAALGLAYDNEKDMKRNFFRFSEYMRDLGVTSLFTTETEEATNKISRYGIEEFIADGVFLLRYQENHGGFTRTLTIRKMRYTNHDMRVFPLRITPEGLEVRAEQVF